MDGPAAVQPGWRKRAEALTLQLVSWPSVTGTAGEIDFAHRLHALLADLPCFREAPNDLRRVPTRDGDGRASVVALVRGRGRRTLILSGHFDTVGVENYGSLSHLACDPAALLTALRGQLAAAESAAERLAASDLAGADFLPGRGILDMKSGVAVGIAVLEAFARDPDREGNLVLVATPDEEDRSRGMRSVRDALPALAREWDLEIVGAINLDATSDLGDGASGRSIFLGSVGKLLPFAFIVGRPAHAGYPFEGVSASLIAAELVRRVEANVDLAESAFGQAIAPPVCLSLKDGRERYDVTMPGQVWAAFNILTQQRTPADILDLFSAEVRAALASALDRYAAQAARFSGEVAAPLVPLVLTVDDLRRRAAAGDASGPDHASPLALMEVDADDPLSITPRLVEDLVRRAGVEGPAAIVGFASLHYPAVHLDPAVPAHSHLASSARAAAREIEASHGSAIGVQEYFSGISDMSFLGGRASSLELVAANTPSPTFVDEPAADILTFPVINIGPWGREFHQKLERVHAHYTFEVLPALIARTVTLALRSPGNA